MAEKVATKFGENHAGKMAGRRERSKLRKVANIEKEKNRKRRNPAEQIAVLDSRLGVGIGARRERFKLNARLLIEQATKI